MANRLIDVAVVGYPWLAHDHDMIIEAAEKRGYSAEIWSPDELGIEVTGSLARASRLGSNASCRVVIPRGVNRVFPFLQQWLNLMKRSGAVIINDLAASFDCLDKLKTTLVLHEKGLKVLPTISTLMVGHLPTFSRPHVVKPAFGSGGVGVIAFNDSTEILTVFDPTPPRDTAQAVFQHHLIQPLASGAGCDFRVVIAGEQVLAATTRFASPGQFVTNGPSSAISSGAPEQVQSLALSAARALGLVFAGVDVIEHDNDYYILEVNCWPGLSATSAATGVNLAESLVDLVDLTKAKEAPVDYSAEERYR